MSDLNAALAAIDAENAKDPNLIEWLGEPRPLAQLQGQLASAWLERVSPDANDAVVIAARAHHVRRWSIPRSTYPDGRNGYLRWRRDLKAVHARTIAELLGPMGVSSEVIERAGELVQKKGLGTDPEAQVIEDVICLVFLQTQYDPLLARLGEDKTADAVRKTMAKMGPAGLALAGEATAPGPGRDLLLRLAAEA